MSNIQVTEVFGEFAVQINGKTEIFATEAEALTAASAELNAEANLALAEAYCDSVGSEGKARKMRIKTVVEFLNFQVASESADEEVEAPADDGPENF